MTTTNSETPVHGIDKTMGALFVGILLASILWGVVGYQAWSYYRIYRRKDSWRMQAMVGFVVIMDTLHQTMISHVLYSYLVKDFSNPDALDRIIWTLLLMIVFTGVIAMIVQFFLLWRLWIFSQKTLSITTILILLALAEFAVTMVYFGQSWQIATFNELKQLNITIWPDTFLYIAFYVILARFHSTSFFSTLNSREELRRSNTSGDGTAFIGSISLTFNTPRSAAAAPSTHHVLDLEADEEHVPKSQGKIRLDAESQSDSEPASLSSCLSCTLQACFTLTTPFTVLPGGKHADGLTENALVVLKDGVYLELISFVHPPSWYPPGTPARLKRDSHRWAKSSPGWIDYAFLGNGSEICRISDIINNRARSDGHDDLYAPEQSGGRTRPDGNVLKWLITAPPAEKTGILPFFCGDITNRSLRVPTEPPSNAEHPSSAIGISHVLLSCASAEIEGLKRQIIYVVGEDPVTSRSQLFEWNLTTLNGERGQSCRLILEENASSSKLGTSIAEIGIYVDTMPNKDTAATPYGIIRWVKG
ncbi:hypothetical protein VNI00_011053 [Paramarasmius palmivorus]|uniref:Glyoxalase-like domain-containing protein n=1 Tax=Paramarasmius palmivorus TaxID=297713 RepID=A0AAW0CHP6_9AGAR